MVSSKQLEANRANARKSTGPRSQGGKARSRLNAVTHGLTARQLVVGAEKPEEFDAFREALFADLEPSGALQCELVDEVARSMWRLRRIPVLEADLLNRVTIRDDDLGAPERRRTKTVRGSLPEGHSQRTRTETLRCG